MVKWSSAAKVRRIRKQRIAYVFLLILAVAATTGLVLYALRQNIDLFYSPSELLASNPKARVRLGGMVANDSIKYSDGLQIGFVVTDFKNSVTVTYSGVLPDLFREGQGVVALGSFNDGKFTADQILAKHDENYMPSRYQ